MSFTSSSAKARARKEFFFDGPSEPFENPLSGQEYKTLKSKRFEKGAKGRKHLRHIQDDIVFVGRNTKASFDNFPIDLKSISLSAAASLQDLEARAWHFQNDSDIVEWLAHMACQSPTARALVLEAREHAWQIGFEDLAQAGFDVDAAQGIILLNHCGLEANALGRSAHYRHFVLVSFLKALRKAHHDSHTNEKEQELRPDALLMVERARTADCETQAILCAWELRAAGYGDVWRYVLGSEEGDMAMVFTRAMDKDPAGFYDGSVFTRTFCQWYGDEERITTHDHGVLERMDEGIKAGQVFGTRPLQAQDIENQSDMPDGRFYLVGMGQNITSDPYFLTMNDPINESHLFQIVYDSRVVMVEGVPFRDSKLAALIFPDKKIKVSE